MAKLSRNKGARIEHRLVALHAEIGVKAERVSLSGMSRYIGNGSDNRPDQVLVRCLECSSSARSPQSLTTSLEAAPSSPELCYYS
jgi:hypothetical protein